MLPVSPKPLCNSYPILHVTHTMKISQDIVIPIMDADFDVCDISLDLTPPIYCPLPSTYSGYWTDEVEHDMQKLIQIVYVRLYLL